MRLILTKQRLQDGGFCGWKFNTNLIDTVAAKLICLMSLHGVFTVRQFCLARAEDVAHWGCFHTRKHHVLVKLESFKRACAFSMTLGMAFRNGENGLVNELAALTEGDRSTSTVSSCWTDILPKTEHVDFFKSTNWVATPSGSLDTWSPEMRFATNMVFSDNRPAVVCWDLN